MKKNILILSAGRRVELIQAFQTEAKKFDSSIKIFATDLNPYLSSACQVADGFFQVPRVTADNYSSTLIEICLKNDIGMIVPTIDTELIPLSQNKQIFADAQIHLIVSDASLINVCRDKRRTSELFNEHALPNPKIFKKEQISFPCFIKPFDGSCSIGTLKAARREDIPAHVWDDPRMMFMEYIDHSLFYESTIDLYYDRNHELQCLVPRKRIETRAGEVSKGVTRKGALYSFLKDGMKTLPGAIGCITLQVFVSKTGDEYYGIEVNPRFGGGFPLAYAAGANYPGWLMKEYFGNEKIAFHESWKENLLMLRYDAKVLVDDYKG